MNPDENLVNAFAPGGLDAGPCHAFLVKRLDRGCVSMWCCRWMTGVEWSATPLLMT